MDRQDELEMQAQHLIEVASDTGRHVRNVYITFLLLCAYIGVIIGSTSHEQLLRVAPVMLPILNVGLPIVGFYIFIPWLLVILHFNLLLQLYFLSRVLRRADKAVDKIKAQHRQDALRDTLFPFHFSHLLAGRQHGKGLRVLLTIIVWVTVMLVPLLLLVWAQVQFLSYHDELTTWIQRAALLVDFAILWSLWPMTMSPKGSLRSWWRCLMTAPPRILCALAIGSWMGMVLMLRRRPLSQHRAKWKSVRPHCHMHGAMTLLVSTLVLIPFSVFVAVLPDKAIERWMARHAPKEWMTDATLLIDDHLAIGMPKVGWERSLVLGFTYNWFELNYAPFRRNLYLVGKVLVAGNPSDSVLVALQEGNPEAKKQALREIRGLENLAGRDLRYADLSKSYLPKANLSSAQLQGANLNDAQLQGANLYMARLQRAGLRSTQLEGANLHLAKLQGADLNSAKLQGANLGSANLQGADLRLAQLWGADLSRAWSQGAILNSAQLQGANLQLAKLTGARLIRAMLQGADLSGAQLQGADLSGAQLQGADLYSAQIQGAIFKDADLSLAMLLALGRGQFTKEDFAREEEQLTSWEIKDQRLRSRVLQYIRDSRGRADDLVFGPTIHHALCGEVHLHRECLPFNQEEQFVKEWVDFVASLACRNGHVFQGIARNVRGNLVRYLKSDEAGIKTLRRHQAIILANRLLSPGCKGGADVPNDVREKLQRSIEQGKAQSVGKN